MRSQGREILLIFQSFPSLSSGALQSHLLPFLLEGPGRLLLYSPDHLQPGSVLNQTSTLTKSSLLMQSSVLELLGAGGGELANHV